MKLYSLDFSPYAARVRMAIYARSLPIEILPPPGGGTRTPEYLAINPIGKVPALVLDDGTVIPESEVIMEFLADTFPDSGLRPAKPTDIARCRLVTRVVDVYNFLPIAQLLPQRNPATRDAAVVEAALGKLRAGVAYLDTFLDAGRYAVGEELTTADCALVPLLFFLALVRDTFDTGDLLAPHPTLADYWARMQQEPTGQKVLGEMQAGLQTLLQG